MNESTLRRMLGTDLADASDVDLRATFGHPSSSAESGSDPDAPTVLLGRDANLEGGDEEAGDAGRTLLETGYELVEEVGRGGMNVVFRARQLGLERDVAVKRLRSRRRASRSSRWSFLSEAAVTAQLDHPNVIPIYGMSVDDAGDVALAMKLTRGSTWAECLHHDFAGHDPADPPPRLEHNLRILIAVTNAVAFAHSRGVLHRDLKPENVMIGEFGEVLVVDWGLAVRFSDSEMGVRAPHRSSVRKMGGTPVYMAPEMVEAIGDALGPWTDIYLLGGMLHEVLTGRPPHRGAKLVDVLLAAFNSVPPTFSSAVPAELQDICRRALAREPSERFGSAREFREAIEEYLAHAESLAICGRAATRLERSREVVAHGLNVANRAGVYSDLREVIAGFAAAREVWPENEVAREGEYDARMLLARSALDMGELGTAESVVSDQSGEDAEALRAQIADAIGERERTLHATRRLSVSLLIAQVAVAVALALWGYRELREYHHDIEVVELRRLTHLVALTIEDSGATDAKSLAPIVARIAQELSEKDDPSPDRHAPSPLRLTVIDRGGRVLADSWRDPVKLPNHGRRPEFVAAARIGAGTYVRWSDTLEKEMVYYAVPADEKDSQSLLVRVGLPLNFITAQLRSLVGAVGLAFLLSVVSMCLVTVLLARHLRRALERLH